MKVIANAGRDDLAKVYVAEDSRGRRIEYVESIQPPFTLQQKWVNIVSVLYGCPINCPICDAGNHYYGKLSCDEILFQIEDLVRRRFPSGDILTDYWKIQFSRMGESAFNAAVLDVLEILPEKFPNLTPVPSLSTIAPASCEKFFNRLLDIRWKYYPDGFRFQYSIHTSDTTVRRRIVPAKTWDFRTMAEFGLEMVGDKSDKVALNFAAAEDIPLDSDALLEYFDPKYFIIKITPLNPTFAALTNGFHDLHASKQKFDSLVNKIKNSGYEVVVSIGEYEENAIGSNCGQYITAIEKSDTPPDNAYLYPVTSISN